MKAISLLQPWASLVMSGEKKWETRSWATNYRGLLLIHASASKLMGVKKDQFENVLLETTELSKTINPDNFHKLPFGAALGYVHLVGTARTEDKRLSISLPEATFGDYSDGRYMWKLTDPFVFPEPIPWKGQLQIWEFPDEELRKHNIYQPSKITN